MPILIGLGILGVILLRGNAVSQQVSQQKFVGAAAANVPNPNAGNAYNPGGGTAVHNPAAVNGNGQALSSPDAAVINAGSQDAVIAQNCANSNQASMMGQATFAHLDPADGVTMTTRRTVWVYNPKPSRWVKWPGPNAGILGVPGTLMPPSYSWPPDMIDCPPPPDQYMGQSFSVIDAPPPSLFKNTFGVA